MPDIRSNVKRINPNGSTRFPIGVSHCYHPFGQAPQSRTSLNQQRTQAQIKPSTTSNTIQHKQKQHSLSCNVKQKPNIPPNEAISLCLRQCTQLAQSDSSRSMLFKQSTAIRHSDSKLHLKGLTLHCKNKIAAHIRHLTFCRLLP